MRKTASVARWFVVALLLSLFYPACCDEYVRLQVFAGRLTAADCERLSQLRDPSDGVRFLCPGEEVTICWTSNVSQVNISGFGLKGPSGVEHMTVNSDTTITASPVGSCAGSKSIDIDVISGPTPSTWTGAWDLRCTKIAFEINEAFMSRAAEAIDITALWTPAITTAAGTVACSTPPFLDGFHREEVFGFPIDDPFVTESFSRRLRAIGHWEFVWKASCPVTWDCNHNGRFPFDLTLACR